ncbi:hypothetical protein V8F20_009540 [Naviculisporaceae sp. PSN 640]
MINKFICKGILCLYMLACLLASMLGVVQSGYRSPPDLIDSNIPYGRYAEVEEIGDALSSRVITPTAPWWLFASFLNSGGALSVSRDSLSLGKYT